MLQIGLSYTSPAGAPTAGFSLEKAGASERTNPIMDEVQESNLKCSRAFSLGESQATEEPCRASIGPSPPLPPPPGLILRRKPDGGGALLANTSIIPKVELWNSASTSCQGCCEFVNHNKIPKWNEKQDSREQLHGKSTKELKKLAREGCWARSHALRAEAYQHIIQDLPCRLMTPDATVYKDVASKLFGNQSESVEPIPEFLAGSIMPEYCLTDKGVCAVKKILICISSLYPDITYCPLLPAVTALLLHYSHNEAQCFENTCRLLYCKAPHTSYIDYSFLTYEASCMTFGDLANKHCPAAHRLIASSSDNIFEVYSEWLVWLFGDLPFDYVIRIFDVYLLEGQKVLYRIALALLKQYQLSVASKGLEVADIKGSLQAFMWDIHEHLTAEKLLEKAFGIRLFSRKEIWLLQMANRKALVEKGVTMVQHRQSFHLTVNAHDFTSTIVSVQEMRIVWSWIPERFSLFSPSLLFSTSEDGYSLQRFYSCCEGYEPTVLLIKTTLGEVCGAFLSSDWNERKKNGGASSFFGTGECFVFTVHPEIERYEWVFIKKPEQAKALPRSPRQRSPSPFSPEGRSTSSPNHLTVPKLDMIKNRLSPFLAIRHFKLPSKTASMFMSGTQEGIIIGGGGGQALFIDANLYHGRTEHCETFDNPPLCQENFQIQLLEVWGFQNS
ncbi:TBC1 domain family member 24-like [Sceloporus undulatus]|uniref:TBC1 domain family member 24-like n=1 Tax=Sceloporus undulatus TaxID=8520 RepID=UPI001C4BC76C|nr:TBC1 domain family member 24-like [Sceloporus undulatus]